jgi:hypothetical protein
MTAPRSHEPLHTYAVEMTKKLHLVIVSADYSSFLHVHPQLRTDGHFSLDQRFPAPGRYYLYADAEPSNLGQQVFRFDLAVGKITASPSGTLALAATGPSAAAGPYRIVLDRVRVSAGSEAMINVHILQGGRPAEDLHPYLGASAHAILVNSKDLTYVHAHPMNMNAGGMGNMNMTAPALPDDVRSSPDMMLHINLTEPGTYMLWLQFRGGKQLYVVPFVVTAN